MTAAERDHRMIQQLIADVAGHTDAQIRLMVRTLRVLLNERKQRRGAEKFERLVRQHAGTTYGAQLAAILNPHTPNGARP